jgi:hypothetical protein
MTNPALPVLDTKLQLYPNPAISNTTLSYTLARPEQVTIDLVSTDGALISRLYAGLKPAGINTLIVKRDYAGQAKIKSGVYMIMLKTSRGQKAVKILFH